MKHSSVFKKIAMLMLLGFPMLAWFFFKPIRLIAPELVGMICPEKYLCVDDQNELGHAKFLYEESFIFVRENVGLLNKRPMIIFCSNEECEKKFGLGRRSAMHLPMGIVISPRAWERHYVSHELIHQLQQQEFGVLYSFKKPKWYLEGMAYLLSDDPRAELNEPLQQYREDFKVWFAKVGKANLWLAGEKL